MRKIVINVESCVESVGVNEVGVDVIELYRKDEVVVYGSK